MVIKSKKKTIETLFDAIFLDVKFSKCNVKAQSKDGISFITRLLYSQSCPAIGLRIGSGLAK
jgi:hypothetical protein